MSEENTKLLGAIMADVLTDQHHALGGMDEETVASGLLLAVERYAQSRAGTREERETWRRGCWAALHEKVTRHQTIYGTGPDPGRV